MVDKMKVKNKNNRMHLEIQTHRKNPVGLIRSTYREDGKVKHQTISRLVGLDLQQLKLIQAALQNNVVKKSDFRILNSKEYGASYASLALARELGLDQMIYSRTHESWVKDSLAMIAGRLVFAGSKLALSNCQSYSSLWEICGITNQTIDVNEHCYNAMDRLFERQEKIQKSLAKKHLDEGALVLYDITSSYLEGEYKDSDLVKFGYNRDKKRGHEQIVISLLCNKEGCPIAVEVFEGNTKDETTTLAKIKEIKEKYGINNLIFVGDRGMVTKTKYEQIDHETVKVISGLTHHAMEKLCEQKTIQLSFFDENNIVEVVDEEKRYCLCKNPLREQESKQTRKDLLELTKKELDKIAQSTRKSKYSTEVRVGKVINKYKMAKFVTYKVENNKLTWQFDEDKIAKEAALDGCFVIYTDVKKEDMTALEAVKNYKSLIKVEQAFRNLKTARLEIRPIHHKTDTRIKCHVFICMLAYYIMWHMKHRLTPLFEKDETGKNRVFTFDKIMELLKAIRMETVDFDGVETQIVSTPNEEQQMILDYLKVRL